MATAGVVESRNESLSPTARAAAEAAAAKIPADPNNRYVAVEVDPATGETGVAYSMGNTIPTGAGTSQALLLSQASQLRESVNSGREFLSTLEPGSPEYNEFSAELQKSEEALARADRTLSETNSNTGEGSNSSPEKPCPDCGQVPGGGGKQSVNQKKKPVSDTNSWYPSQPFAGLNPLQIGALILESIGSFFNNLVDIFDLKEGKCRTCKGKRAVEDKSDQTPEIQKTVAAANAQKDRLLDLESRASGGTGLGGNDITFIVGNKFVKVGAAYNDFQSYESISEGKDVPSGLQGEKRAWTKQSRKIAQVNGLNPLPTIGGNYTMEVGNHFKLRAGAQGIELSTEGPLIIKAGQTQMVGPEVVIGTATGETRISGNHLQLDGDSIALTPGRNGDGQVITQGTHTITGNMVAIGGAHVDGDLSFVSATCPYKEERTKHSSQEAEYGGPARWSGIAAAQGLRDLLRTVGIRTLDPSAIIASPRQIINFFMDYREALEKALPLEPFPTGVILPGTCYVVGALGPSVNPGFIPVFNFPHHHTLTDQIHAHNMRVPNINLVESDEQVRLASTSKASRAPVPINKESALLKLFRIIQIPYQAVVAAIQRLGG